MTVREALEEALAPYTGVERFGNAAEYLAPKIEAALRAAYDIGQRKGWLMAQPEHSEDEPPVYNALDGVTAGIEAMQ